MSKREQEAAVPLRSPRRRHSRPICASHLADFSLEFERRSDWNDDVIVPTDDGDRDESLAIPKERSPRISELTTLRVHARPTPR